MDFHPLCKILPEMPASEYRMLVDDIRAKGLMRPITTYEGLILDGRHRFNACADAGVEPRFETYTGTDPAGFVASSCVHRNLSASQRALIAAGFLEYEREQAKKRAGTRTDLCETFHTGSETGRASDKAGERMHVSGRTVDDAAKVIAHGVPELVEKVRSGEMSVSEAKKVTQLNPNAQRRIAAADTKKTREHEINKACSLSNAAKRRDNPHPVVEMPGTPFLRKYLASLERLAIICAEDGFKDGVSIAAQFDRDMDWSSIPLSMQYDRTRPVLDAIAIIEKYRTKAA